MHPALQLVPSWYVSIHVTPTLGVPQFTAPTPLTWILLQKVLPVIGDAHVGAGFVATVDAPFCRLKQAF